MDREEVKRIAKLARLHLDDNEVELYAKQMDDIIGMFAAISEVDTTGVRPMTNVHDAIQEPAEDKPAVSLSIDRVLANAPAVKDAFIQVPQVLKKGAE